MDDKQLGMAGETAAIRYLQQHQYTLLARNFRTAYGEIDIIARDQDTIVFVEVKTRTSRHYGRPCEAVSSAKRQKIIRMANTYLCRYQAWDRPCRFDVIEVFATRHQARIHHIRHAFWVE